MNEILERLIAGTATCSKDGCEEPAVVAVHFPTMQAVCWGCENHREATRRTLAEGRASAIDTMVAMGLAPIEHDEGPQWIELP